MNSDHRKTMVDVQKQVAASGLHRFVCHCTTVYSVDVNLHACCLECGSVFVRDDDDPGAGAVAYLVDPRGPVLHVCCELCTVPDESKSLLFAA